MSRARTTGPSTQQEPVDPRPATPAGIATRIVVGLAFGAVIALQHTWFPEHVSRALVLIPIFVVLVIVPVLLAIVAHRRGGLPGEDATIRLPGTFWATYGLGLVLMGLQFPIPAAAWWAIGAALALLLIGTYRPARAPLEQHSSGARGR